MDNGSKGQYRPRTLPTYSIAFDLKAKPRSCSVLYGTLNMVACVISDFVGKDGENAVLLIVTF